MNKNKLYPSLFPVPYDVEAGKSYLWCGCGKSSTEPLCDKDDCGDQCIEYRAMISETVLFCGCKKTASPPFCDGTHAELLLEMKKKK